MTNIELINQIRSVLHTTERNLAERDHSGLTATEDTYVYEYHIYQGYVKIL